MRLLVLLLCGTLFLSATPVLASPGGGADTAGIEVEGDEGLADIERPWLSGPFDVVQTKANEEAALGEVEARIADLKARRATISRKWPTVGVIAGGALTSIGAATLSLNTLCGWDDWGDGDGSNCTAGWVVGGVLAGSGVVLLGTSGWILAKRTQERRAIDRQIEQLQKGTTARRAPSFGVGFDVGERKGVRLAWRY
jgi:hypothetical protein